MLTPVLLSFGYDKKMLATRSMFLRGVGYRVEEVFRWSDAHSRAQSDIIDAILICNTVPLSELEALVSAIRSHRRLLPILSVSAQEPLSKSIEGCIPVHADHPAGLLDVLHVALFTDIKVA
jgi:DNA-binding response OmpR family regulator